jgi:hypothetical protein
MITSSQKKSFAIYYDGCLVNYDYWLDLNDKRGKPQHGVVGWAKWITLIKNSIYIT